MSIKAIEAIGLSNYLNCILVMHDVRPAMLIQPQDRQEALGTDPKTKALLDLIQKHFPSLKQSHDYQVYQGVLISKEDFKGRTDITLNEMGRILGYPCYNDFQGESNEIEYVLRLNAEVSSNTVELFSNICKTNRHLPHMKEVAIQAQQVLRTYPEFKDVKVLVDMSVTVSKPRLIRKLERRIELTQEDKDSLLLYLGNISALDYDETVAKLTKVIQYNNPLHQGLLLGMILHDEYNPLSPFFPLQNHPEMPVCMNLSNQLVENLLLALTRTRTRGGTRRKK